MAFMEGILKPCQRKVLFKREYSAEQNTMIYKCELCYAGSSNQLQKLDGKPSGADGQVCDDGNL